MKNDNLSLLAQDLFKDYVEYDEWININNPFIDDSKFHMGINKESLVVNCFKTGYKNSLKKFLEEYIEDKKEAREILRRYGLSFLQLNSSENKKEKENKVIDNLPGKLFDNKISLIGKSALKYLYKRGFDKNLINKYKLRYCFDGEYKNRIIIPFYENNIPVYFIARSFLKIESPRYKNPLGLNSNNFVFNYDNIDEELFICEGVFDAMYLNNICTATLKAEISKEQCNKILNKSSLKRIIFVPDNDEVGLKNLFKNIDKLRSYLLSDRKIDIFWYIPEKKDLNESGKQNILITECTKDNKLNRIKFKNERFISNG